ncbi:MAG: DUF4250 domain-containing protein [Bacteroidales bacterium]|nr:DUF4250 domain-containing protein [Bacteroidales bacterium]MBD5205883.1 DUF4250 domain-containing protein [Bacteroidales bacterium]MBD5222630.1 DUF4250 domain-containing protein [Bacteroidales bacterium]MBD5302059.1 DUF4250 domain-containing protein [Bacteroides sp.]
MNNLPQDPFILLSFVNMRLRDEYADLDDLCSSLDVDKKELEDTLASAGFTYDSSTRQFR